MTEYNKEWQLQHLLGRNWIQGFSSTYTMKFNDINWPTRFSSNFEAQNFV